MNKHFDVSPYEDIRDNEDAVERAPFFLRNFDAVLENIDQDVLQV